MPTDPAIARAKAFLATRSTGDEIADGLTYQDLAWLIELAEVGDAIGDMMVVPRLR